MKRYIPGILIVLTIGSIFLVGSTTKRGIYPKSFILYGQKSSVNLKLEFPDERGGFSHWWLRVDNLKAPPSTIDSLSFQYCIARSKSAGDTLAQRPNAWRFAQDYTGGLSQRNYDYSFSFVDSGLYVLRIDQDGIGYDYLDFLATHVDSALADCLKVTISQTMNF